VLSVMAPTLPIRRLIERRRFVLLAAGLLFALVFALRLLITGERETIGLLYVVPISLVALELGLLAGVLAAAFSVVLLGAWSLQSGVAISILDFVTRAVAYLSVGVVAGRFGERMREVHRRQEQLLDAGLQLAHLDRGDELPVTLARQAKQLVPSRGARVELRGGESAQVGDPRADGVPYQVPIEVRGSRYGMLTVAHSHPIREEDHATLEILALQAAVAAENWRLLASERERALIRAELQEARVRLADRAGQLRELITRQEAERHELAYQLSEQAAQSLAAVLLGLAALERELGSGLAPPRLGSLRSDVDSTIRSLRSLAVGLRPPALSLGLRAALERLAEAARVSGIGEMQVALQDTEGLSAETETMVYRVVEEALAAVGAARLVCVRSGEDGTELIVDVEGAHDAIVHQRLAVLRARMELIGGTLSATERELRAAIPLRLGDSSWREPELREPHIA
jgi:signal transduction histidine kinase